MGFVSSDGTTTKLYDRFRNADTQGSAMSDALRTAFSEIFERNEYAHELEKDKLTGLVTEITGASKNDSTTKYTVSTFLALKEFADFDAKSDASSNDSPEVDRMSPLVPNDTYRQQQNTTSRIRSI
jgi:hypothetical protein